MIKTINKLLDVIGELEDKQTPIQFIYNFLGGKTKLEFPKEWLVFDPLSEEIKQHSLSKPPQDMPLHHFMKGEATIPKIKTLLEQHVSRGVKESFLIISIVLAVDLILKFFAFGYRDALVKRKQLLTQLKENLKLIREGQRLKEGLDERRLKKFITNIQKTCVYDKGKEAACARDYVIWRKLTGLDDGIDFFHDYCDLPTDPDELQKVIERLRRQLHFDEG